MSPKGPRRRSSSQWPVLVKRTGFTPKELSGRLMYLQRTFGITIIGNKGKALHTLKDRNLTGALSFMAPLGEGPQFVNKVFHRVGTVKATCERIGFKKIKNGIKIPLSDILTFRGLKVWLDYFGPMLRILMLARKLHVNHSIGLLTDIKEERECDDKDKNLAIHEVADRKVDERNTYLPLLNYLEGLAIKLSNRRVNLVSLEEIRVALDLWEKEAAAKYAHRNINFEIMIQEVGV
jgi:hypothetical protein